MVLEKTGRMRAFTPDPGVASSEVILDLSGRVATPSEQGLIGLAFDPAFTENRFFYVHYSVDDDASQPLEERARTYLDVNCAQCNRPDGGTSVALELRFDTPLDATNTVGAVPQAGALGIDDARIIAPGARGESVLWERMRRLDASRMPPLASHRVDEAGVELIGAWIDGL